MNSSPRDILRHAVFIAGPTSVGKSAVACLWAARSGAELVNADAFQLYREFPILSAQPSADDRQSVPHHLFGCVSCHENMDAARYADMALGVIGGIVARGRTPIVVGGSGLYLQALLEGLPALPAIDPVLRDEVRALTLEQLVTRLRRLDPVGARMTDLRNPRRVSRRVELCLQTGRPASELLARAVPPEGLRGVVFTRVREDLHARIAAAVAGRLSGGALGEVRSLRGVSGKTALQILGWREINAHLDGDVTLEECRERLVAATRRYARRQLTWFRSKSTFPVLNLTDATPADLDQTARRLGLS